MDSRQQKLQELKSKIRDPKAAAQMRVQLGKANAERKPFDAHALQEFIKENRIFHNLDIVTDEE